jgi:hypothetical protein
MFSSHPTNNILFPDILTFSEHHYSTDQSGFQLDLATFEEALPRIPEQAF